MSDSVKGRFAPSPSGRMHLGNLFTATVSWLSAKSQGGRWLLRIEDLDPQRSRMEYARQIEDDLLWLGLEWDEGGLDSAGDYGPYLQSARNEIYSEYFARLTQTGMTYPCYCSRADILATQAPHQSDGRVIYGGRCRPASFPCSPSDDGRRHATRLFVPDREIAFTDLVAGRQSFNLARDCGDFVVRRADGAWAYQLAVVVDDALMGVTEVVRGNDLLLSAAQQIYLYELSGLNAPSFAHLPLICNDAGQRLSKRDAAMGAGELRKRYSPHQLLGIIGHAAGITPTPEATDLPTLIARFSFEGMRMRSAITI